MGELFTRGTIDLALVGFFGSLALRGLSARDSLEKSRTKGKEGAGDWAIWNWARWTWSLGALLLLVHIVCAFHYHHDWSHAAAVAHTARQTEALLGFAFGGGVWINYLFAIVWTADALWWWQVGHDGYRNRSAIWRLVVFGFLVFIVINGAIVFEDGIVRWASLLALISLAAIKKRTGRRYG